MKSSRLKFAKKLKSIRAAGEYLNQDRILQVLTAADGISEFLPKISNPIPQITSGSIWRSPVTELVEIDKGGGGGEEVSGSLIGDKENVRPPNNQIPRVSCGSDIVIVKKSSGSGFRRPDLNSSTLFDPKLLEAFELAVLCFKRLNDLTRESNVDDDEDDIVFPADVSMIEEKSNGKEESTVPHPPLLEFEERCPPGGEESVVFYTTTLRGIRKTFDDCNMIRFLLDSFKVKYNERDVSMHREYREELRRVSAANETEVLPPVLFVKGKCIGGAQQVLSLHEQGKFRALFDGIPLAGEERCRRCDGIRFLMCDGCRGSRRIVSGDGTRIKCLLCNENGLIVCVDCS